MWPLAPLRECHRRSGAGSLAALSHRTTRRWVRISVGNRGRHACRRRHPAQCPPPAYRQPIWHAATRWSECGTQVAASGLSSLTMATTGPCVARLRLQKLSLVGVCPDPRPGAGLGVAGRAPAMGTRTAPHPRARRPRPAVCAASTADGSPRRGCSSPGPRARTAPTAAETPGGPASASVGTSAIR